MWYGGVYRNCLNPTIGSGCSVILPYMGAVQRFHVAGEKCTLVPSIDRTRVQGNSIVLDAILIGHMMSGELHHYVMIGRCSPEVATNIHQSELAYFKDHVDGMENVIGFTLTSDGSHVHTRVHIAIQCMGGVIVWSKEKGANAGAVILADISTSQNRFHVPLDEYRRIIDIGRYERGE